MAWWSWNRRKRADVELIDSLLKAENDRRSLQTQIETQRLALEGRRLELEFEHLEQQGEQRRKDREAAEKLREQRRQWAASMREKRKLREQQPSSPTGCRVCANPGDASLTAAEIAWHHGGHRAAQ